MKCIALAFASITFSSAAFADPVVKAYEVALASAKATISLQSACEVAIQRDDVKPCIAANAAYADYSSNTRKMLSAIGPPPDTLYRHIKPEQGEELVGLANQITASMDKMVEYTEPK